MIMNPVIQGGAAEEKVYKITNEAGRYITLPESAKAGEFVDAEYVSVMVMLVVKTEDGQSVPSAEKRDTNFQYFVMPSKNVVVSAEK